MRSIYVGGGISAGAVAIFFGLRWAFCRAHPGAKTFYFDPQDAVCDAHLQQSRVFPKSAATSTFEPMLRHYIGVVQLLVTVAAASLAFGGVPNAGVARTVLAAKLLLAWSVFFGVLYCAILLWRYDEYAQDRYSYTLFWYSTVFALGFSCLTCFMVGYLVWGIGLLISAD
jgi:hypothetical protein